MSVLQLLTHGELVRHSQVTASPEVGHWVITNAAESPIALTAVLLTRHPYTRAVSLWRAWDEFANIRRLFGVGVSTPRPAFRDFLGAAMKRGRWRNFIRGPGRCSYHAAQWGRPIQHIVKYERLEIDTGLAYKACFCPEASDDEISPITLPRLHGTSGPPWHEEYTPETAAMVQSLWAEDFLRFDYAHNFQDVMFDEYTLEREELYV